MRRLTNPERDPTQTDRTLETDPEVLRLTAGRGRRKIETGKIETGKIETGKIETRSRR
jgi:hypothetical protein